MAKINVLEPEVFNKIAAGEVVERPASVVKELVENSIDAGAKNIDIFIIDGGTSFIQITDDGCGIEKDEVRKAFLPHATSKIKDADDLESILTLGFRGEALASIASVSEVCMTTRTAQEQVATMINLNGGIVSSVKEIGSPVGTQIQVKNLFFNIPVRRKHLKKPKQEESAISEIVARLILANPNISFTYTVDDKVVYQSLGKGKEDALYSVYGASMLKNVIPIDFRDAEIEVSGFICKQTYSKPNSTYQTIIVNGRYVNSKLISTALGRVYEDYMMTRAYPFFVIYINLPADQIDVNAHPTKMEVRFYDTQRIFGLLNHIIDETLLNYRNSREVAQEELFSRTQAETYAGSSNLNFNNNKKNPEVIFKEPIQDVIVAQNDDDTKLNEIVIEKNSIGQSDVIKFDKNLEKPEPVLQQRSLFEGLSKNLHMLSVNVVGKIFNTFLIVEIEDKVYFIDQHAAHERILYDRLVIDSSRKANAEQPLLLPYILETNNTEYQFIMDNIYTIRSLGFEIDEFGKNAFKVSSIPAVLPNLEIGIYFNDILKDMNTILSLKTKDLIMDYLAQKACKHAVKGGDDLTKEEIVDLLEEIARNEPVLQCPHGRPFAIEVKKYEIDKWFKRIVWWSKKYY